MVILEIDFGRALARPAERDPEIGADADGPPPGAPAQGVEPVSRDIHVLRLCRGFERLENTHAFADVFCANPPGTAGSLDLFETLVPEAGDHTFKCKPKSLRPSTAARNLCYCNGSSLWPFEPLPGSVSGIRLAAATWSQASTFPNLTPCVERPA
jgi:hypothetical protein